MSQLTPFPETTGATAATGVVEAGALEAGLRRLHLPSILRCYPELAQQALAESWSYAEYLERLVLVEIDHRTETRIARATRKAGFPFLKTLEEFDFAFQKSIQRKVLGPYLGPELVSGGRSLILWGAPGVGKLRPRHYLHRNNVRPRTVGNDRRSPSPALRPGAPAPPRH